MYAGICLVMALMLQVHNKPMDLNFDDRAFLKESVIIKTGCEEKALSDEEYELLAKCVMSEAGDQPFEGICLVVDVILNRAEQWGLTITEVIYQKTPSKKHYQFEVVENGRLNKASPTQAVYDAINQELKERMNTEILYFCMYRWFDNWADYCFKLGDHYFYKEKGK